MTAGQYEGRVCEYVLMCSGGGWWGNDRGGPERGHKACVLILSPEDLHTHTHTQACDVLTEGVHHISQSMTALGNCLSLPLVIPRCIFIL